MAKINSKINNPNGGRKVFINAPGRPATVSVNNGASGEEGGGEEPASYDVDGYLQLSLIGDEMELVNDGKGIQQVTGGTNAFTKYRFCWGFNEIHKGDRLIWKINIANYSTYVYLNEIPYGWSNDANQYAVNAQIGAGGLSKIALRDRDSAGSEIGTRADTATDDLFCFLFNMDNTVSLQKWNGSSWDTYGTSNYVCTEDILYAGVKTFRPEAGVKEIYRNTATWYDYPTPLTAQKGAVIGDSTMDFVNTYILTATNQWHTVPERLAGYELVTLADGGDTISQQKTVWTAYADKATLDYVVVQVGLNNLYYQQAQTPTQLIDEYQDLIDTITADVPGITIIVSTMTPAKQRWYDIIPDPEDADYAQSKWEALNEAIRGEGSNPITGVDARVSQHTTDLDDGTGNLIDQYQHGDEIHTNGWGREINIRAIRAAMKTLNIIA